MIGFGRYFKRRPVGLFVKLDYGFLLNLLSLILLDLQWSSLWDNCTEFEFWCQTFYHYKAAVEGISDKNYRFILKKFLFPVL